MEIDESVKKYEDIQQLIKERELEKQGALEPKADEQPEAAKTEANPLKLSKMSASRT